VSTTSCLLFVHATVSATKFESVLRQSYSQTLHASLGESPPAACVANPTMRLFAVHRTVHWSAEALAVSACQLGADMPARCASIASTSC